MKKFDHKLNSVFSDEPVVKCFNNHHQRFNAKDLIYVEIDKLKPNKGQPRKTFDEQAMEELKCSIEAQGILQPILARYNVQQDYYEIVAGERRLLAAKLVSLTHVPVLIAKLSDEEASVFAIIENIQRKDLTVMEEAEAYNRLINEFNLTHEEISKKVGKSRSSITNLLRILNLSDNIKEGIIKNKIHLGHAKIILSIDDNKAKENFYEFILKNEVSVRDCEKHVEKFKTNKNSDCPKMQMNKDMLNKISIENIKKEIIYKITCLLQQPVDVGVTNSKEIIIKIKDADFLIKKLNFLLKEITYDHVV